MMGAMWQREIMSGRERNVQAKWNISSGTGWVVPVCLHWKCREMAGKDCSRHLWGPSYCGG